MRDLALELCRALLGHYVAQLSQYVTQGTSPDPFYLEVRIALRNLLTIPRSAGYSDFPAYS